ncbi:MAG: hypothetical protein QGG29_04765 [Prochlorococcaceae cyanobacterium ETNP18_MAG_17]|nr:hypothetical protein [Prochlorococcaceae cyanobacterium ETNP18_MAG_17]MDP6852199.1 hypothetical protein [Prochlorococcaceae cyanobacterium ETNP1_MAG_8]
MAEWLKFAQLSLDQTFRRDRRVEVLCGPSEWWGFALAMCHLLNGGLF